MSNSSHMVSHIIYYYDKWIIVFYNESNELNDIDLEFKITTPPNLGNDSIVRGHYIFLLLQTNKNKRDMLVSYLDCPKSTNCATRSTKPKSLNFREFVWMFSFLNFSYSLIWEAMLHLWKESLKCDRWPCSTQGWCKHMNMTRLWHMTCPTHMTLLTWHCSHD